MPISFHSTDLSYNLKNKTIFRKWIRGEIKNYSRKVGQISIIFCSDHYLLEINKKYLNHDYYTDIITFNYNEEDSVAGDLYISIERVKDNSISLNTNFNIELRRVMIHGIFHLLGHEDYQPGLKKKIHEMEDKALMRFPLN